jgi:hypothetical protein
VAGTTSEDVSVENHSIGGFGVREGFITRLVVATNYFLRGLRADGYSVARKSLHQCARAASPVCMRGRWVCLVQRGDDMLARHRLGGED